MSGDKIATNTNSPKALLPPSPSVRKSNTAAIQPMIAASEKANSEMPQHPDGSRFMVNQLLVNCTVCCRLFFYAKICSAM